MKCIKKALVGNNSKFFLRLLHFQFKSTSDTMQKSLDIFKFISITIIWTTEVSYACERLVKWSGVIARICCYRQHLRCGGVKLMRRLQLKWDFPFALWWFAVIVVFNMYMLQWECIYEPMRGIAREKSEQNTHTQKAYENEWLQRWKRENASKTRATLVCVCVCVCWLWILLVSILNIRKMHKISSQIWID